MAGERWRGGRLTEANTESMRKAICRTSSRDWPASLLSTHWREEREANPFLARHAQWKARQMGREERERERQRGERTLTDSGQSSASSVTGSTASGEGLQTTGSALTDPSSNNSTDDAAARGTKRRREDDDEGEEVAFDVRRIRLEKWHALAYYTARLERLHTLKREIRVFNQRGSQWRRREVGQLRHWIKARGASRSRRLREPQYWINRWARAMGLDEAEQFDAHRWGENLRTRTVKGELTRGEWPSEDCFGVYKWRRYERRGEVPKAVRLATTYASQEMWLRGPSLLGPWW